MLRVQRQTSSTTLMKRLPYILDGLLRPSMNFVQECSACAVESCVSGGSATRGDGTRLQMNELTHKDRVRPKPIQDTDAFNDSHLFLGTPETRGSLMLFAALAKDAGELLHFDSLSAKERRRTAHERSGAGMKQ